MNKLTASEKLAKMMENDELTDEQLDNISDWNIDTVDGTRDLFKMMLTEGTGGVSDKDLITVLYELAKFSDDYEYVYVDDNLEVKVLTNDVLEGALNI